MKKRATDKTKQSKGTQGKSHRRGWRGMLLALPVLALLPATALLPDEWHPVAKAGAYWSEISGRQSYFAVKEIRVTGSRRLSGAEIVSLAGLKRGMNMWDVHPKNIEARIRQNPWVRRDVVQREFPQRVFIRVEEWVAKAIIVLDKLYYVDPEGYIFKEVEARDDVNFPFLTGLGTKAYAFDNPMARQKIVEAIRLNDLLSTDSVALSEIRFLPQQGLVVYPTSHRLPLYVGWGEWLVKVRRLERVLAEWKDREGQLASMDLRFRDRVVVKLKGGA